MKQFMIVAFTVMTGLAAHSQTNNGEALSAHISNKMRDTLNLSPQQRQDVFNLNQQLHQQKQQVRLQYPGGDSLAWRLQQVERTRDSLYRPVLGEEKYLLYKQRKTQLISSN